MIETNKEFVQHILNTKGKVIPCQCPECGNKWKATVPENVKWSGSTLIALCDNCEINKEV